MKVLIDTSVWSTFLRRINHENLTVKTRLIELIEESRAKLIGPIRQELLSGIASETSYNQLKNHLRAFEDLPIQLSDYERAAEMFNLCRKKGIQGSQVDFLICSVAERDHLSIYTLDNDFKLYAKIIPIMLF